MLPFPASRLFQIRQYCCIIMGNCIQAFERGNTKVVENVPTMQSSKPPASPIMAARTIDQANEYVTGQANNHIHILPIPTYPPGAIPKNNTPGIISLPVTESQILSSPGLKAFCFDELRNATANFREDSLLGEGGFGYVYKGWLDAKTLNVTRPGAGMAVAVKKLKPQGFQGHNEWLSEVNYLGRLHHPNLVKLFGYCLEDENRLLVYEYMPRGSLENHLFRTGNSQILSWETRIKIAIAAARGLCFLHDSNPQVIYRDFKSSNILLDSEFHAKLSDFGLAKAGPTGNYTHVTTRVMGTHGYCAPEYAQTGRLTFKCDVYSFGIVLLELLTGRRVVDDSKSEAERHLVSWVKPHIHNNKRKVFRIMDTRLGGQYPQKGAYVAANLALLCVNYEAKYRPPMTYVLEILENLPSQKLHTRSHSIEQMLNHFPLPNLMATDNPNKSPVNSFWASPLSGELRSQPKRIVS